MVLATIERAIHEVLRERCHVCGGTGWFADGDEPGRCEECPAGAVHRAIDDVMTGMLIEGISDPLRERICMAALIDDICRAMAVETPGHVTAALSA